MKIKRCLIALILLMLVTSCAGNGGLPTPSETKTSMPDVTETVKSYLDKWQSGDYAGMYTMLSQGSRDSLSEADFTAKYTSAATNLTLLDFEYGIVSSYTGIGTATVVYQLNLNTSVFGLIQNQPEMTLVAENGAWKVKWDDGIILKELAGGNNLLLSLLYPSRGAILDRNGNYLVQQADAVALGIDPNNVTGGTISSLLQKLAEMTKKPINVVEAEYQDGADAGLDYIPVGETSKETYDAYSGALEKIPGFMGSEYSSRYYYVGGISPQVLGYTLSISAEDLAAFQQLGYTGDEKVGAAGLEKWGEQYLAGKPEAGLYVMAPDGTTVARIAHHDPEAAYSINTTIDKDFQVLVQKALLGFTGAAIVMEVDTGKILAMASSPAYDPNLFQTDNVNSVYQLNDLINDQTTPMWNRATQSSYPLGSVFKVVTMSAAMESGLYTADTVYDCTSQWTELGTPYDDWTYTKGLAPSGELTLVGGLKRSCNPYFYHIALDLFRHKSATYLADMARGFGLGSPTGIEGVLEDSGAINDPTEDGGASQMGIGQGDMLVTPIQVVDFMAAIANGGTLYTPQVIQSVVTADGQEVVSYSPQVRGKLPISETTLAAVQEGMKLVVSDPEGTAYSKFLGLNIAIYGKTGTATTSMEDPHSWFAGFTAENRTDKPDIAVVVILENMGDGSKYAAPVFRRIVEDYYYGAPQTPYAWEFTYYYTKTPLPETETPTP
jgi:penicillin-binding protein 2